MLDPSTVQRFREDGFVLLRGFLSHEETDLLSAVARADPRGRGGGGRETELLGLPKGDPENPKTTLYDALCYSERMVAAMEQLLLPDVEGGEITLHHRKIIMKDEASATPEANAPAGKDDAAGVSRGGGYGGGNRFYWHQDYSYWCEGNPYQRTPMPSPDVVTCAIAIDPASRTNGCLQMLKGSHSLGLLEFDALPWGERHTTDQSVQSALESCDRVFCEQEPGDALFFSCLTVHCSDSNTSARPRWAYLCAFDHMQNAVRYVPEARPAPRWSDSAILEYGRLQLADGGKLAWEGETEPSSQEDKVAEGRRSARL